MDDTAHIACCFDKEMELPFLVLANSIKKRLKGGRKVVLHAFHSDPLVHDRAFSKGLDSDWFEVRFLQTKNEYDGVSGRDPVTSAKLMRLMLPALLPGVDRLVCLDTDMIVLRDITELHDTDLNGRALAAVPDYTLVDICAKNGWRIGVAPNTWHVENYMTEVVELTDWRAYFNSGVMVMDLDRFRKSGFAAGAVSFLEKTEGRQLCNEQDALNHVIDGAFVPLDPRWNVVTCRSKQDFDGADADLTNVATLWWSDPWIIHYAASGKPWMPDRPATPWDERFWIEAAGCEALPLLLMHYLKRCEEAGYTGLLPAGKLLAVGKPALDKSQVTAHARKFASIPEVTSASARIAADLEFTQEEGDGRAVLFPPRLFSNQGGVPEEQTLVFDLAKATGHIVYGPYLWYPSGKYEAVFEISLESGASDGQGRLVVEVTDNSFHFLAQQFLSTREDIPESCRTLAFEATGRELFFEFRVFADGFSGGVLRFSGVSLKRIDG